MPANSIKIRISIDLPREEYQALHQLAERRMVSHREVVRAALAREMERMQAKIQRERIEPPASSETPNKIK